MDNKKIATWLGTVVIIIFAVTVGFFIWQYEKNNQEELSLSQTVINKPNQANNNKQTQPPAAIQQPIATQQSQPEQKTVGQSQNTLNCNTNFNPDCCFIDDANFNGYSKPVDNSEWVSFQGMDVTKDRIDVTFKEGTSEGVIKEKVKNINGEIISCLPKNFLMFVIEIKGNPSVETTNNIVKQLNKDTNVVAALLDRRGILN